MYFLVMEYDKKTSFVPPFSIFSHIFLFVRWLVYKVCRKKKGEGKYHCGISVGALLLNEFLGDIKASECLTSALVMYE